MEGITHQSILAGLLSVLVANIAMIIMLQLGKYFKLKGKADKFIHWVKVVGSISFIIGICFLLVALTYYIKTKLM